VATSPGHERYQEITGRFVETLAEEAIAEFKAGYDQLIGKL
jgi:hypothetical protein